MYQEKDNIELKRELTDAVKKEIVAFLNTMNGTILVGVIRCLTGNRENERTQPLQRPHPYLGTSGTHSDEQKQVI